MTIFYALTADGVGDPTFLTNVGASSEVTYARGLAYTDKDYTALNVTYVRQAFAGFAFAQTVGVGVVNPQIATAHALMVSESSDPTFYVHVAGNKGPQYVRTAVINDTDPNTLLNIGYARQTLFGFSQAAPTTISNPKFFTNYDLVYDQGDPVFFNRVKASTDLQMVRGAAFRRAFAVDNTTGISTTLSATFSTITQAAVVKVTAVAQVAMTLRAFAQAAQVTEKITGTAAQTLPTLAQEFDATQGFIAAIDQTLFGFTQADAAAETFAAVIGQTLPGFIQEADVSETLAATIDQTLPGFIQQADAAVEFVAAADQTLFGIAQEADATLGFPAVIDQTLLGIAQDAAATLELPAAIAQTLPGFAQSAQAYTLVAAADQTLPGFTQAASTDVENPAGAVFGEIAITFQGFTQRAATEIILPLPVADEHEGERGRGGGSAPKEIPRHEWEVDLFRAKEYRRNFDMAVPPVAIANVSLGSIASPPPRPVSVPLPPFVKPQ